LECQKFLNDFANLCDIDVIKHIKIIKIKFKSLKEVEM